MPKIPNPCWSLVNTEQWSQSLLTLHHGASGRASWPACGTRGCGGHITGNSTREDCFLSLHHKAGIPRPLMTPGSWGAWSRRGRVPLPSHPSQLHADKNYLVNICSWNKVGNDRGLEFTWGRQPFYQTAASERSQELHI